MPSVSHLFSLLGSERKELVRILAACGNKSSFTLPNPHDTCNLLDQQTGNPVILNLLTPSSISSARSRQILSKPNPLNCFVVCASRRTPRIRIHFSYTFKPLKKPHIKKTEKERKKLRKSKASLPLSPRRKQTHTPQAKFNTRKGKEISFSTIKSSEAELH